MDGGEVVIRDSFVDFADAASTLLSDPGARLRIAAGARRTAEQHFSWDAIADTAFDSYQTLVALHSSQRCSPSTSVSK
jgi:glycosyltransferase involved in cell wall biosynthesis